MIAPDSRESGGTRRGRVRVGRATPPRAKGGAEEECADEQEGEGHGEGARREPDRAVQHRRVGVEARYLEDPHLTAAGSRRVRGRDAARAEEGARRREAGEAEGIGGDRRGSEESEVCLREAEGN